jgi:iron complex outermembrane receptor protein
MLSRAVVILSIVVLVLPLTVSGQNDRVAYQLELDNVNVEGKRPLKLTGLQLTQLDSLVLRDNISQSMADILTQKATVFVKSYGRATQSTAEFRGTSPSHTQVTWNGMRINSPMIGTVDFSLIPSYFMDDATLYYGASSVSLTGGGLGGAVELNTASTDEKGFGAQYVAGFGSFSTYDQFLRLSYGGKRWKSSTRVVFAKSENDYKYTNYDKKVDVYDGDKIVSSYHPEERNKSGYFTDVHVLEDLSYKAKNGDEFNLAVWYMSSLRGLPFLSVDYKDDTDFTNEQNIKTARAVLSWKRVREKYKLSADAGYTYSNVAYDYFTTRLEEVLSDITHSRSYTNCGFGRFDVDYSPSERWFFTGNVTLYDNAVRSEDKSPYHIGDNYDKNRLETSTSVSARWRAYRGLSLAAMVRQETYGNDVVAPIAAFFADYELYKPWNLVLKASIARNYRYPSMDDCYFQPGGNPDLNPERGFTYDGGVEWNVVRKRYSWGGNVAAFDSRINDWILWTPTVKGFWSPSNVKKVHNYGVEATMNGTIDMSHSWRLKVDGSFAWTPSKNVGEKVNSNDESYGKQLCYIPKLSSSLAARLEWRGFALTYKFCHYSERFTTTSNDVTQITGRLKPYFMSNLSLEKHFHCRALNWSLKGVVNNLLNTEYVTVLSRPMPRRNYEIFIDITPKFRGKS